MKKRNVFLLGLLVVLLAMGLVLAGCGKDDDSSNSNNNNSGNPDNGGGGGAKSIKITGLDDFYGSSYQLGLATTVDKLDDEDLVAFAEGTIRSGTQTAPLLDYKTGNPWTGSGSYYVGVYLDGDAYVTKSKKSFSSSVTTLSINDFDAY